MTRSKVISGSIAAAAIFAGGVLVGQTIVTPSAPPQTSPSQKRVLLLKPRGFCAGVVRAIDIVKIALETFGAPIYVRRRSCITAML
jgi:uncharacterized membrane protein